MLIFILSQVWCLVKIDLIYGQCICLSGVSMIVCALLCVKPIGRCFDFLDNLLILRLGHTHEVHSSLIFLCPHSMVKSASPL